MLVGIPFSAQFSQIESRLLQLAPDLVVENDEQKTEYKFGDIFREHINAASRWMGEQVKNVSNMYRNLFWDQANLSLASRRAKIDFLLAAGYDVVAVAFEVPTLVTSELGQTYVRPTRLEGFSKVIIVTPTEEYVSA